MDYMPSVKGSNKPKMGNKAAPRAGAAKGQGGGLDGYNAAAVNKAMASVAGGGGKPVYAIANAGHNKR